LYIFGGLIWGDILLYEEMIMDILMDGWIVVMHADVGKA
jgi:hypothetical protein